jgi:hypothetical protein
MIDVAITNYLNPDEQIRNKCFTLYKRFLNSNSKEVIHAYSISFLRLEPERFLDYFNLINIFSTSNIAKRDPHYYYDYLLKCAKNYPEHCIDLISHYKKYDKPNQGIGPYYEGNEPMKILISSYNVLYEHSFIKKDYLNKTLLLFDEMLQDSFFRTSAEQVLIEL